MVDKLTKKSDFLKTKFFLKEYMSPVSCLLFLICFIFNTCHCNMATAVGPAVLTYDSYFKQCNEKGIYDMQRKELYETQEYENVIFRDERGQPVTLRIKPHILYIQAHGEVSLMWLLIKTHAFLY